MRARRQRNLSRHQKIFCKSVFHTKATPLWDGTIFGQGFGRGVISNFQNQKVPPTGGSSASQMTFERDCLRGGFEISCQACSSSSKTLASFKSRVSKPSVNQP